MATEALGKIVKRRVYGALFIVIIASLVALSIAFYNKSFTDIVTVTLRTDHTGNQLVLDSDVKERGIIVGSVQNVRSEGDGAIVTLALDPSRASIIPNNVSAQVLPKTLFGEQYVSLTLPADRGPAIKAGDTIGQDRSQGALETAKVLGDLLPLLNAVQPAELNATLTAVATALRGRGQKLGETLVGIDKYLKELNTDVTPGTTYTRQLVEDLKKLGQVALVYNDAAPDIVAMLDNLQTSVQTVLAKKAQLDNLLTTATDTSGVVKSFLNDNEQRLITLLGTTNKVYALLDEYSPEFTCLFAGMNNLQVLANGTIQDHAIQLSVVMDNTSMGKYKPGEQPKLVTGYGPHCFGLPDHIAPIENGHFQTPTEFRCLNDGAALTADSCGRTKTSGADQQAIGSPAEDALVNTLIASSYGTTPDRVPAIATALAAPLLRGAAVNVR
jgi:phospholipid/cholesterol/gamma-HCH transport system substrate-binding protein